MGKDIIRELQGSFEVSRDTIASMNNYFLREFPLMRVPISNLQELVEDKKVAEILHMYGEDKKRFNEKKYVEIQSVHKASKLKFDVGSG